MATNGLGPEITELRLGLPGSGGVSRSEEKNEKKRVFAQIGGDDHVQKSKNWNVVAKSQLSETNPVVGWPPVCAYRRKNGFNSEESTKMYVKVSMDGAPFLRKINLSAQKDYSDLEMNLEKLFGSCFGVVDGNSSEYVPIYEDKDGDWMLVGDVPWTMFVEYCKKLRIMKRTEANGIGRLRSAKGSFERSASQDG